MGSLNITGAGLLDFVFQQLYAGLSAEEADRVRAVLAPQYAALAQFLQGSFNGADQVNLPPEVFADPLPPTDPGSSTSAVSVTQAMAVAAATTLLNEPGAPAWLQGAATAPAPALLLDPASASWLPVAVSTSALFSEGAATSLLSVSVSATQPLAFGTGVPEPSTLLLAAAGLVLALGRTRHARR